MIKDAPREFKSRMTKGQTISALVYLPIHAALLPIALVLLLIDRVDVASINFIAYAIGAVYMLIFQWRFLRRDFDTLCDKPVDCLVQVLICYGIMLALNMCVGGVLGLIDQVDNPNNAAVVDMADVKMGATAAMAIFLAPIVEELMFRGAVFGLLRRYNRVLAYAVSILLFSAYHVWSYVIENPVNLIYILQYLPASYALCRCYERTETIWSSIFMHMLTNGIAIKALDVLGTLS